MLVGVGVGRGDELGCGMDDGITAALHPYTKLRGSESSEGCMAGSGGQALRCQSPQYFPDSNGSVSSPLLAAGQEISTTKVGANCRGRPTGSEEIGEMGER